MYLVEIGQCGCLDSENMESIFRHQCLLLFLYSIYSNLSLENNSFETFIGPRDEKNVLRLALSHITCDREFSAEELNLLWIEVCKQRLFFQPGNYSGLVRAVEQVFTESNVIDRIHLLRALKLEYEENALLMEALHGAEYIVVSSQLSWFETQALTLLIEIGVPYLRFVNTPDLRPFHSLQLCSIIPERYVDSEPVSQALLAYLAVAVNIKNTLALAFIINKPFRGFGKSFFSVLRRVAKNSSILPGQLVLSYPACMTGSVATSSLSEYDASLLHPSAPNLAHLANTLRTCQDALSGYSSDDLSLATSSHFGGMSTQSAAAAVRACLTAAVRAFKEPLRNPTSFNVMGCPFQVVREAKEGLFTSLEVLTSSPLVSGAESLLTSTPNRPTHLGGSIQGRAAFRLARLFLVFEAAGQVSATPTDQSNFSNGNFPCCAPKTPIGQRTITAFFQSPCSVDLTPKPVPCTDSPKSEEAHAPQLPKRPLHARYQSNLEWATIKSESPSPISARLNLTVARGEARHGQKVIEEPPSPPSVTVKKPRLLFGDEDDDRRSGAGIGDRDGNKDISQKKNEIIPSAYATEVAQVKKSNSSNPISLKKGSMKPTKRKFARGNTLPNQPSIVRFLKESVNKVTN